MTTGVDLPGNDYDGKPIAGTAIDCQTACTIDGKCAASTWVKHNVQNAQAMCRLKSSVLNFDGERRRDVGRESRHGRLPIAEGARRPLLFRKFGQLQPKNERA